ncbi:MAG TPA: substrate-binding domain-containing protein [bacterium]|nr:substrate-binding domain-containing protein [Candidatus Omnitrophota bacterium]HOL94275.1 substrate-binding domain-containing protein [bacterium]HPO99135.1 substrate-binding domain-containing protein [bacterium]HXK94817.1 substrate-binding domain-containing protein [bacterium]
MRRFRLLGRTGAAWMAAAWLVTLAGCGQPSSDAPAGTSTEPATAPKLVIAVIPKGTSHLFWQSVHAGALTAAKELGVEINWNGPPTETMKEQQISIVHDFIVKQVDGIVLAPQDQEALVGVVEDANNAGIPVVIFDSGINTGNYVSFVATDNYKGGVAAAEKMGELLQGQGSLIITKVDPGSNSTLERERGFEETLKQKFPGIRIVDAQFGYSDRERSRAVTEDMLAKHPDVQAIFGPNESSTSGALLALQAIDQAGKKFFVGFDSAPQLIDALRKKEIHALVLQNPFKMGYESVKAIVSHLQGQDVPKRIDTGVYLITPDNMDEPENQKLLSPDLSILQEG